MSNTTKKVELTKNQIENEALYGWLFLVDFYSQCRYAVHRDDYVAFCNGKKTTHKVHKSKTMSLDDLAEYVKLKEK